MFRPVPVSLGDLASERLARTRTALARSGCDVLCVGGVENILYVSGYESLPGLLNRAHQAAAFVTGRDLVLVLPAADFAPAIAAGVPAGDILPFGTFFFSGETEAATIDCRLASFEDALEVALSRLPASRVLVDWEILPERAKRAFSERYPERRDARRWMLELRAVKLGREQALLRHAAEMTERALEAGIRTARVGMTDKEVAGVVASAMSLAGGLPRHVTVAGGPASALADVLSTERPLAEGDLLRFDIGCSYYGYKSDIARTAVMGEPTALQRRRYDALERGLSEAIAVTRAGTAMSHTFDRTVAAVERCGLSPFRRHHVGHAIGLSVYEWPVVAPAGDAVFQVGATFCLETPYYEPGWGGMMVEETGVVTEHGFEPFTTLDRSLRVIPAS